MATTSTNNINTVFLQHPYTTSPLPGSNSNYTYGGGGGYVSGTTSVYGAGGAPGTLYTSGNGGYTSFTGQATVGGIYIHGGMQSDITISRPNGQLNVGASLEMIMDMLGLIQPDHTLMDKHPALKDAYEAHVSALKDKLMHHDIKDTYNSYHTVRKLVLGADDNAE
jgi:hypothetical protein